MAEELSVRNMVLFYESDEEKEKTLVTMKKFWHFSVKTVSIDVKSNQNTSLLFEDTPKILCFPWKRRLDSLYKIKRIPFLHSNHIFLNYTSIETFKNDYKDEDIPINSNILLITDYGKDTVDIWDVYRSQPTSELR